MKRQVHAFSIGNKRRLVLEVNPDNNDELEFVNECKQVSDMKPGTIQDFFVELARLQKRKTERTIGSDEQKKNIKR